MCRRDDGCNSGPADINRCSDYAIDPAETSADNLAHAGDAVFAAIVGIHFRHAFYHDPNRSSLEAKSSIVEVNHAWPLLMWRHYVRGR